MADEITPGSIEALRKRLAEKQVSPEHQAFIEQCGETTLAFEKLGEESFFLSNGETVLILGTGPQFLAIMSMIENTMAGTFDG